MTAPIPRNAITSFSGDYFYLDNFYPSPIESGGVRFPTVEHGFQAAKARTVGDFYYVATAPTPGAAKLRGRAIPLRSDWEDIKTAVMEALLRLKFAPGSDLAARLLSTGDAVLIEGNTWDDRVWGQCPLGVGENRLGQLLMQIRAELRARA